jgi:hypothetical protein
MTFLVGQQGTGWTIITQGQSAGGNSIVFNNGYLATAGTATSAKVWINEVSGASNVKVFVYDAGGNRVGQSGAINVSGGGIPGLLTAALDSSIVLTAQLYKLVLSPDTGYVAHGANTGAYEYDCDQYNAAAFSYASPPATLPAATVADDKREFIVWLDGSTGGSSTVAPLAAHYYSNMGA